MFKLSLAFSAATLVVGQITVAGFCNLLSAQCTVHGLNATSCVTAFTGTAMPAGSVGDGDVNTIGCRQKYLDTAPWSTMPDNCRYAGPSGGGRCGPVVDGVCAVATQACAGNPSASFPDAAACVSAYKLNSLDHQWGSIQGANGGSENSLECRVYHAIVGLTSATDPTHCGHFNVTSTQCSGPVAPDAVQYCEKIMYNCNGTLTQYGNKFQCAGIAAGLPNLQLDARASNSNNTLGCREYHSQAAKADPAAHCQHAGPSGGTGQCGTRAQAWGSILAAAPCRDTHVNAFLMAAGAAVLDAAVPAGGSPYSISLDNTGNTQACRIYHLGVAANTTGHCSHGWISGDNNCGTSRPNLCKFIGATCGWGTNATWQYADENACLTAMTPTATQNFSVPNSGRAGDATGNNYECRFYHAGVAATFKPGGMQASSPTATLDFQAHCSHALAAPRVNGCNPLTAGSLAPTAKPAGKSSAPETSLLVAVAAVLVSVFSL